MNIVIFFNSEIPALHYGGTQRVVYYLARELHKIGHKVTLLIKALTKPIEIPYIIYDPKKEFNSQIPKDTDIIHIHSTIPKEIHYPYVFTMHGNPKDQRKLDINTIFVSKNHAQRFNSSSYVHNGLDWNRYLKPDFKTKREYYHFLGNGAWRVKNLKSAIDIARKANQKIKVLGGVRFNVKMGLRFTWSKKASFYGMVGGELKDKILQHSKGLIFPVLWHEPFGLAIIESLYFGGAVFATPYGSLNELVTKDVGVLSTKKQDLIDAVKHNCFDPKICHQYAYENFNSKIMAINYLKKYEIVLNGHTLNQTPPMLQEIQKEKFLKFH
jgi:glycosyltransferase involved in cell wall biosynthesis